MPTYYVFHPNIDITAEVNAPNPGYAKTTFLDYLSRHGIIGWRERQYYRKGTKASKMEPGEIYTTVQLSYAPERAIQLGYIPEREIGFPLEWGQKQDEVLVEPQPIRPGFQSPIAEPQPIRPGFQSPVMELSRRTFSL